MVAEAKIYPDYSLSNPDTLTKYKTAAQISQKALETVSGQTRKLHLEYQHTC
jgi:methionine aminopeptidase